MEYFTNNTEENKKIRFFNGILAVLFVSCCFCAFRLPINILLKQQSTKNERICPITFYSLGFKTGWKKHITFTFQHKSIRMKSKTNGDGKIKILQAPQKFIQLQVRKNFRTYVVEDYEVK